MNVGEAFNRTLGIMDEFSVNGTLRTASEYADYRLRFNRILDRLQKDLATVDKISANTQLTQYPFENMLGVDKGFDLIQHFNDDIETVQATGARAYYFETVSTNSSQALKIQEETSTGTWSDLETVAGTSVLTSFTGFKGLITASSTANAVRLLIGGSYPYRVRNTALWSYLWASSSQVPDYKEWVKYTMSSDFMELDKIVFEDGQFRQQFADYYWENPLTLCVNYAYQGSFTVFYWKYPTDISSDDTTPTTYDSTALELSTHGQEVLIYGCAAELLMLDPINKAAGTRLLNIYSDKRAELSGKFKVPANDETIREYRGW